MFVCCDRTPRWVVGLCSWHLPAGCLRWEDACAVGERAWHVVNPGVRNRFERPVTYVLYPQGQPVLLADESSSIRRRASFATNHLWVTRYDLAQRYAAGDYVNQHLGGAGLPEWTVADAAARRRARRGRRAVAYLRLHALHAARGLAGDAGGLRVVHAETVRLLRPQPWTCHQASPATATTRDCGVHMGHRSHQRARS